MLLNGLVFFQMGGLDALGLFRHSGAQFFQLFQIFFVFHIIFGLQAIVITTNLGRTLHDIALLAVAVVLAVVQFALVLRVKGAAGKLALGGKEYAFKFSKNAYLMMQLGAVALAVIVAAGVFAGSTLLALGIAAALFIVTGVYYTVKLV